MRSLVTACLMALLSTGLLGCSAPAAAPPPKQAQAPEPTKAAPAAPAAPAPAATKAPEAAKAPPKEELKHPERPITFVTPYDAGGAADLTTRWLAEKVSTKLGTPIMIVNKGGGSGAIGLKDIMDSKPDGYTLGNHGALATNKLLAVSPYDQRSVTMIGVANTSASVVVCNAGRPWKTIQELIAHAKANPEKVSVSTNSKGSMQWISAKVFESLTGTRYLIVPEPEAGGAAAAKVAGGHTDVGVAAFANFKSQLDAGTIRLLTVIGTNRAGGKYADVPAMEELGYKDVGKVATLRSIIGPKGLPAPIHDKLMQFFGDVAKSDEYKRFLADLDTTPLWLPGEEGVKAYDTQEALYRVVLAEAGLLKTN